jgi:hypothetical protein
MLLQLHDLCLRAARQVCQLLSNAITQHHQAQLAQGVELKEAPDEGAAGTSHH